MTTILVLNSTTNGEKSFSRKASDLLLQKLDTKGAKVIHRNLHESQIPHLTSAEIAAFYTPADKHNEETKKTLKLSDELISEINACDILIIGSPMINFSISSSLKAYIDHIARAGVTFKYENGAPVGLLAVKNLVIIASSGGVYSNGFMESLEHNAKYLKTVFGFLGVKNIDTICVEGVAMDGDGVFAKISNQIDSIAKKLI